MVSKPAKTGSALALAFTSLPALIGAWLVLRIAESIHAAGGGLPQSTLFGAAIGNDVLALLRYGFAVLLPAAALAAVASPRARTVLLGLTWSLLLCVQAALLHYQWTAGVPLGADWFAYSRAELATTLAGAASLEPLLIGALLLALAVLWALLFLCARPSAPRVDGRVAFAAVALSMLAWAVLPERFAPRVVKTDAALNFVINKSAYFADHNLARMRGGAHAERAGQAPADARAALRAPWEGKDPRYPFLRFERTPDTLGPLLNPATGTPPNLVFIIVEGLGRSFSGPGARFGSYTPFLDELASRSLYFENFLAPQGRTFGVLTTMFGSLPFGESGLAALGARMPAHDSLTGILKEQGYRTRFYSGSNLDFDNEGAVLRALGVDDVVGEQDFGADYERSNDWGYGDRELMRMALAREATAPAGPHVTIIQTTGMHSPFTFPGRAAYVERTRRMTGPQPQPVSDSQRAIFASVLYLDDALRTFFEQAQTLPGYANTIFFITGDHRLPELPMDARLERYHVPLIVHSPLLKEPRAIKAVSSQFDIAPGVLAYLSNSYGLTSPGQVAWLGTGLDTEPSFRNLHAIPLKQTKTELSDFVSGTAYLAQDRLYTLADGMQADRVDDPALLARARAQFDGFVRANRQAGKAPALRPDGIPRVAYGGERTLRSVPLVAQAGDLAVSQVRPRAGTGALTIEATVTNHAGTSSRAFAPLLVVTNEQGIEVTEVAGDVRTLAAGESWPVALRPDPHKMPPGVYHVSVIPSDPDSGRPVGSGQYRVEVRL